MSKKASGKKRKTRGNYDAQLRRTMDEAKAHQVRKALVPRKRRQA